MKYEGKGKGISMDRKEIIAIAKQRLEAQKSEAVNEELLKNANFEAGMTIEEYKAFLTNLESESVHLQASSTKSLKDSCDFDAEENCKEMDLEKDKSLQLMAQFEADSLIQERMQRK